MSDTHSPAHHLLSLRVENKSGVLARVAGLFSRRGFNIVSLAVAPTEDERFSRIAIVADAESAPLQQIVDQLDKLINVVEITQIDPRTALEVELLLATISRGNLATGDLAQAGDIDPASLGDEVAAAAVAHGATVLESDGMSTTLMLAASPVKLDALEADLRRIGIVALQRTGRIALPKLLKEPATTANS